MKYTYQGNKISMKRASPEWFNSDCPEITASDGTVIVQNTLYGFVWSEYFLTKKEIADFVLKSYKAFCKKYKFEVKENWGKKDALFN